MLCVCFASIDHSEIILLRKNSDNLLKIDNTELLGMLLFGGVTWFVTFCPNSATDSGWVLRIFTFTNTNSVSYSGPYIGGHDA